MREEYLIEQFWMDFSNGISQRLPEIELDLREDSSDYEVVDGEEGDNGVIRLYDKENGVLVATYVNKGGDDDWWDVSDYGKKLIKERIKKVILDELEKLEL